ncbi:hypothetical protein HYV49_00500 [Candidatus Pacearchaeota archaeon]|nr:hypothetical protein [Candidatus Pacearchaeota archaeon]
MEKAKKIAPAYYSRKDVLSYIYKFAQNRETIPRYGEDFGKRPDYPQYETDLFYHVKNGATSFHVSEELWHNPLQINTDMHQNEINELRKGWDLLIDIDSKYFEYSRIAASLIVRALEFHGIKNVGIKFSGSRGLHIIIPCNAFPQEVSGIKTKDMFPEWARAISLYLTDFIKEQLINEIGKFSYKKSYIKDFEAPKEVMPDIVLVAPRHLFRAPYSLHEKTALASIVIDKDKIESFDIKDADPLKVKIKEFYPQAEKDEAKLLLEQALDWHKFQKKPSKEYSQPIEVVDNKYITEEMFPPVIKNILKGVKQDGRKRALFILISFFNSLNFSYDYLEKTIAEWNKKNYKPLKEGYIKTQVEWSRKNKKLLPPNFDSDYYKAIGVYETDDLTEKTRNPVTYVLAKARARMKK